jgi:phenylalanyl-tRNA synthetase beta chain
LNIEADLVEEVARAIGYDKIPVRDEISIRVTPPNPETVTIDKIRSSLVASGYFESITVTFISEFLVGDFTPPEASKLLRTDATVRIRDAHLRPSILPGLLEAIRRNENVGTLGAKLFEIGSTFWVNPAGKAEERRRLALVGSPDYREVRGTIEVLLNTLNADREIRIIPDNRPGFAAGACGRIEWGGQLVGYVGRVDRAIADKLSLRELPAAAELEISVLLQGVQHVTQLHPLSRFPAVRRDLSLVLSEDVRYEQLSALIQSLHLENLEEVEYVTTYRGKPLTPGTKSVTVTLIFRSSTGTLTSDQVEALVQRAIQAAQSQLQATLRA